MSKAFTGNDALDAGHDLVMHTMDVGLFLPECEHPETGERCFTFATTPDVEGAHRRWLEHAAEAAGVCSSCSHPDDRSNRDRCYRCWLMDWSDQRVLPKDAPEFPAV